MDYPIKCRSDNKVKRKKIEMIIPRWNARKGGYREVRAKSRTGVDPPERFSYPVTIKRIL